MEKKCAEELVCPLINRECFTDKCMFWDNWGEQDKVYKDCGTCQVSRFLRKVIDDV